MAVGDEQQKGQVERVKQQHKRNSTLDDGSAFVEMDPSERYGRFEEQLGRGACKVVYKAFDTQEGREVAWNKVDLATFGGIDLQEQDRILAEIRVLKTLKHKNIMSFYKWWYNEEKGQINFISELFSSGTLRQYRKKHKHLGNEVLKQWAWQILCGLVYLHGHHPPIVHRDLKCDNIFINGADGVVKIGDLGLATLLRGSTAPQSVLGTPEFMAPELYEEYYDDRVDVYAFGMAMLELATLEYPYSECTNAAQIYRKVSLGVRPAGLQKVTCRELAEFINTCIAPLDQRPRSRQLLKHKYFDSIRSGLYPSKSELMLAGALGAGERGRAPMSGGSTASFGSCSFPSRTTSHTDAVILEGHGVKPQRSNASELMSELDNHPDLKLSRSGSAEVKIKSQSNSGKNSPTESPFKIDSQQQIIGSRNGPCRCAATNRCFEFAGKYKEDKDKKVLNLRLKITEPDGSQRTVEFGFDMNQDTATSVASEMVGVLELSPEDAEAIALAMSSEIQKLVADLEGQASSYLVKAAAELQQELRDTALQQANAGEDEELEQNNDVKDETNKSELYGRQIPSLHSLSSFHSMESAHSNAIGSFGGASMSSRSSPTRTNQSHPLSDAEGGDTVGELRRINSGELFQKVHVLSSEALDVASQRTSMDRSSSPHDGIMSPELPGKDMQKRALSKLYENLQEVVGMRKCSVTPPPAKPPLPPSGSKSSLCLSSPPSLNGDVGGSPNEERSLNGNDAQGMPIQANQPGLDKDARRKQALDALKAVEIRSLTMLEGNGNGGHMSIRGIPMSKANNGKASSDSGQNTASSSKESGMNLLNSRLAEPDQVKQVEIDAINSKLYESSLGPKEQ